MLRLRSLREEAGKTQSQIAEIFNISRQAYANYENEINQPSLQLLLAMADYFQCSTDYLLGHTDDFGNVLFSPPPFQAHDISTEEKTVLDIFRKLSTEDKKSFLDYVYFLRQRYNP